MRTLLRNPLFPLLLAAAVTVAGCGKDSPRATGPETGGSGTNEQAEIASALAEVPEAVEDGAFETEDEWTTAAEASAGAGASVLADIRPLRWWRTIRDVERRFEFAFSDTDSVGRPTRAVVTIHKHLRGAFHIVAGTPAPGGGRGDSLTHLRKPLADHWVRRVLLHRVRTHGDDRVRWRVAATSGVEVTSQDAKTDILSLRVQTASQDTTIENPRAFWFLRRLVRLAPGEDVTLTVTTAATDDLVVLIHRGGRFRFHNNGDGTHTGRWRAPLHGGLRHVGVNALSRGTLFDDAAPYDSRAWILPYAVTGDPVADYRP